MLEQYENSVDIQSSSKSVLKFLVSDLLDFSQLKSGKFRKNIQFFNLKDCIQEMIMVLKYKASQMDVEIEMSFKNFEKAN